MLGRDLFRILLITILLVVLGAAGLAALGATLLDKVR
jgi:hypothetical protein